MMKLAEKRIGSDNEKSISAKAKYGKEEGLPGYFAWHFGNDDEWILFKADPELLQVAWGIRADPDLTVGGELHTRTCGT
ncbi:hypothetical protein Patl1_14682 [Pistacia atlantica]|uniref:Uncharacterized protein n=1 Tax=Pistacia atlantica TaxID=434234 RepID=A0ACC1AYC8_9ROSI|nr:hypothetical protein Patl1_14682 [Pistacia atlantica]